MAPQHIPEVDEPDEVDRGATSQVTQDIQGGPPPGTPPERVRVALVPGSGPVAADDLYGLLRRRLLVVCTIVACLFFVAVSVSLVRSFTSSDPGIRIGLAEWFRRFSRVILVMITGSVLTAVLWRRPPRTVRGLRLIELVVIGVMAATVLERSVLPLMWAFLEESSRQPSLTGQLAYMLSYASNVSLQWFLVLTLYGTFIPNTWRRCAAVVAVLAACQLILYAVWGSWVRPLDPLTFGRGLSTIGFWLAVGGVIAVVACSRIEILHRQAGEARKLGQYVLKEKLGGGGMGEVYRAEHVLLRRPCALKIIRPERAGDPKNLRRFEREVQTTATLTHPNTVQIYDYGHAADGTFYYVMEYLPGLTLEELVKREGPLASARAIHFLRQVCGALKEAHGRGLIHRDIKPGNVMICERGGVADVAKLLDFGLVLPPVSETDGEKLTQDGMVTGTPAYLSPEQAGGQENVDARSDIYGLGALAYFLLTGQPPFANRSGVKMLAAHLYEEPERLLPRRPDIPPGLEAVVLRCLAKDPARRFPDVESLDAALASHLKVRA
ncbi:MAG: serine/threonine-protein kinase [Candidatus Polarisedimenticolia bacterium]